MTMCNQKFVIKLCFVDGPTMEESGKKYSVCKGDSVTLICGTDSTSNPKPIITWTPPQTESGASRYVKTEEPNIALTINNVKESDGGIWKCTVEVNSKELSVACPDPNLSSRTRNVEMEVTVIGKLLIIWCCLLIGQLWYVDVPSSS